MPQIAINWLLQRPTVSSVIIGARNEAAAAPEPRRGRLVADAGTGREARRWRAPVTAPYPVSLIPAGGLRRALSPPIRLSGSPVGLAGRQGSSPSTFFNSFGAISLRCVYSTECSGPSSLAFQNSTNLISTGKRGAMS